jgi:hypothetical protein
MAYSQIKIFSPEDQNIEYQNARTDREGLFAFVPNTPGQWSFEVNDGQGHLAQGSVTIAESGPPPAESEKPQAGIDSPDPSESSPPQAAPMASGGAPQIGPARIALGLSVILNIALIGLVVTRRRKSPVKA